MTKKRTSMSVPRGIAAVGYVENIRVRHELRKLGNIGYVGKLN